ncbi:flagellin [Alphaproteobacteria bacterium]|nr:flagellin [Alphaproteobacteria bacterium]
MTAINTNVGALMARANAKSADAGTQQQMRRLSSGLRVNSAADDAAGLAVGNKLGAQLRGIEMGIRNSNDAIALLETADSGLSTNINILQRMREIAVQMANDVYTANDRINANLEFSALELAATSVSEDTKFNETALIDSTFKGTMRIGNDDLEVMTIEIGDADQYAGGTISTQAGAITAVTALATAIDNVSGVQATVGSYINRLQFNVSNLSQASVIAEKTLGSIMDADYAKETSSLAKNQILNQAATSMLAQANQSKQSVLALLQ